jgi:hypothetical protein
VCYSLSSSIWEIFALGNGARSFHRLDILSNAKEQKVIDGLLITVYIELKNTKRKNSVWLFSVIIDSGIFWAQKWR